jgi:leucyl-tRNA synthetase
MSNIENMRGQLRSMGAMFDFDSEIVTCLPEYYRWNQWFFLKFFQKGLAYRKEAPVDWCPKDNTTLAREQVVGPDRRCERCGTPVIKKNLAQWFFKITDYADELLNFSQVDWPERVKTLQTNWIGRSEGAEIEFDLPGYGPVEVFTTRPDTLYGTRRARRPASSPGPSRSTPRTGRRSRSTSPTMSSSPTVPAP